MDLNMTTKDFLYFKTIADEKSISKAAKKLYIAQPSLSQYIKRIEVSIGVPLFIRSSYGISLTDAGKHYYTLASIVLKSMDDFANSIIDVSALQTGRINIGITRHLGTILLSPILSEFKKQCPNIQVEICEATSQLQEEMLLNNHIDFSLMHLPLCSSQNPSIQYTILEKDPLVIVLPPESPLIKETNGYTKDGVPILDIRKLKDEPFVFEKKGQRLRQIADNILRKAEIYHPKIIIESTTISTIFECISAGLGVALMPKQYLTLARSKKHPIVCAIPPEYNAFWHICVATASNAHLSSADNLFIAIATKAIHKSIFENDTN